MIIKEALEIIDQVCASFRGNRADHIQINTALDAIRKALTKKAKGKDVDKIRDKDSEGESPE